MDMGFQEMPTNKWVESSFWNFDALFQPQSHPARDAHDTFFIKDPAACNSVPEDYYAQVCFFVFGYDFARNNEGKDVQIVIYVRKGMLMFMYT